MTQTKYYRKAPITEALIDLRIVPLDESNLVNLQNLHQSLVGEYTLSGEINLVQGQLQQKGSALTATTTQSPSGYRFISTDKTQVFQACLDGFTFSQLEPYKNWETLRNEAKRLWELYSQAVQPKSIERSAVRYINRLDLPLDASHALDFKDYLRTVPEVSTEMFQGVNSYFMQLQIPQIDLDAILLLNEGIISPSQEGVISVLLDIDLSRSVNFDSHEDVWVSLDGLRLRKNEIFEACITDKLRELLA
jgi:uncharacterized protein (TIGR04255 family)